MSVRPPRCMYSLVQGGSRGWLGPELQIVVPERRAVDPAELDAIIRRLSQLARAIRLRHRMLLGLHVCAQLLRIM